MPNRRRSHKRPACVAGAGSRTLGACTPHSDRSAAMLILPLHRPLTRDTFPFVTALLFLANVLVFFVFQVGDGPAFERARKHYLESELPALELPAYEAFLQSGGRSDELQALRTLPAEQRGAYVANETLTDVAFVARLRQGELFADTGAFERWKPLRARYDDLQQQVFTLRHLLRSSEIDPWRMLASAFLHGGFGHLLGNMIFLAALGLLVEGALGGWRFLGVYLLGALGSSAISLAWRWGEAGGGLGASGAIAALMGAFCVVWGRQPVRFFYWFGVVFDYIRKPAILLLPVWLGWEIYNLFANPDLGVGFDAHAGGIVTGAALGAALVGFGQVRRDFIEDDEGEAVRDDRWERAQAHLGRLQLAEADTLLAELQHEQPDSFELRLARYRVASNAGVAVSKRERTLELLDARAPDAAALRAQLDALAQASAGADLALATRQRLVRRAIELQDLDLAERLLQTLAPEVDAGWADAWFQLALRRRSGGDAAGSIRALQTVVARFPREPQAGKARFLLENS
jgi:membrane associated rhomboid family serine protease